ncbi:MAG: hypothetical protein COV29_01840 [Candidatus Yanofskybacteria bacterium CG10_big_fil_rev_8_21_14_0_10_36_16]|uniref:Uncharacterized protein n=1 Tax=Candidatus Yanofskybacteria bacterium CG10_big_fil_rev_8_21_14_0_10_36_16 TaxID=1975096 RepID=A0A2J0Q7E7_9BACT|nr:MAG: hypothetical protein COV29_01840 [Candidatus Yanofskybacteria bacterium CG10_big_fil_rev_8_21_14_0_10_36_16]
MSKHYIKLGALMIVAFYFIYAGLDGWHFFDGVDLIIHEAGHFVFLPFGEFIYIAGGTLLQLLMPALFVFYFFKKDQFYSASLVTMWLGQSFINVSVYVDL